MLITAPCFAQLTVIRKTEQFKDAIANNEYVVAKFHAIWCPACVNIGLAFKETADEESLAHIAFLNVDVDENENLARQYKIRSIPAFIFFKNGEKIRTEFDYNPLTFKENLTEKLNTLFVKKKKLAR